MPLLHIEKLDGENIRRAFDFLTSKHQRGVMLLTSPPLDRRSHGGDRCERTFTQHAKQVDIGKLGMKLSVSRRTVNDHALEIVSAGNAQPADKFVDLFFCNHSVPLL